MNRLETVIEFCWTFLDAYQGAEIRIFSCRSLLSPSLAWRMQGLFCVQT